MAKVVLGNKAEKTCPVRGSPEAGRRVQDDRYREDRTHLGVCHSRKTKIFSDAEWAPLTLAVHIKRKKMPLLVTCAKPGHAEPWMEAFFHASITSPSDTRLGNHPPGRISVCDLRRKGRRKKTSTAPRYDSILDSDKSVDWGIDFEEFRTSLLQ